MFGPFKMRADVKSRESAKLTISEHEGVERYDGVRKSCCVIASMQDNKN